MAGAGVDDTGYGPWSPYCPADRQHRGADGGDAHLAERTGGQHRRRAFRRNSSGQRDAVPHAACTTSTGTRIDKWLSAAEVACTSGGICTMNAGVTLAHGAGSWQVIAWNPTRYSPWSATMAFIVPCDHFVQKEGPGDFGG